MDKPKWLQGVPRQSQIPSTECVYVDGINLESCDVPELLGVIFLMLLLITMIALHDQLPVQYQSNIRVEATLLQP